MSYRPRLLLLAATAVLPLVAPPAHAEALHFTYAGGDWGGTTVVTAMAELAVHPVLGQTSLHGRVDVRPSGRTFSLVLDDVVVPDGTTVHVGVWQAARGTRTYEEHCVPLGRPYAVTVASGARVTLLLGGAVVHPYRGCDAPVTAGTGSVLWG